MCVLALVGTSTHESVAPTATPVASPLPKEGLWGRGEKIQVSYDLPFSTRLFCQHLLYLARPVLELCSLGDTTW